MINIRDALTLAYTKLRTRRIRTAVTVLIASLLFGVIVFALIVLQGGVDSMKRFTEGTLSERYLAMVTYSNRQGIGDPGLPDSVKQRAQQIYTQLIADKKAAAKRLGIDYDPAAEQKPVMKFGDMESLDATSPAAIRAYNEYKASLPSAQQIVNDKVAPYKPLHTYTITQGGASDGAFKPFIDGAEDFTKPTEWSPEMSKWGVELGWQYADQSVLEPFMLSKQQLSKQTDMTAIPVIAPVLHVEKALGLSPLPRTAPAKERLTRLEYVKSHAEQATFSICYRNTVSQQQIDEALRVEKEIEQNKSNKDYRKPALMYGLPGAGDCAPATVVRDVRTASEKQLEAKQLDFASQFGQTTQPIQRKLTFRVVGLSPNGFTMESFSNIDGLLMAVAGSTLQGQWVVPTQLFDAMPNREELTPFVKVSDSTSTNPFYDDVRQIAEFKTSDEAKRFVDTVGCGAEYCEPGQVAAAYFGSNAVLIEDIRRQAVQVLAYVALAVATIAALIMMGMIGRVIGDSRRETAVFRAIGATRHDIRAIYVSYTLMLASITVLVSLTIGALAAWWLDMKFAEEFTVRAHLIYIFTETGTQFRLLGVWWEALLAVAVLVLLAGVVGMLLPLGRNLARSPIKDMRDDT